MAFHDSNRSLARTVGKVICSRVALHLSQRSFFLQWPMVNTEVHNQYKRQEKEPGCSTLNGMNFFQLQTPLLKAQGALWRQKCYKCQTVNPDDGEKLYEMQSSGLQRLQHSKTHSSCVYLHETCSNLIHSPAVWGGDLQTLFLIEKPHSSVIRWHTVCSFAVKYFSK